MLEDIRGAKACIRKEVLGLRAAVLAQDRVAWSAAIVERVAASGAFCEAEVYCGYVSMAEEVQVGELALLAAKRGCPVYLPAFDVAARLYRWRRWAFGAPLGAGHWQIPEPAGGGYDEPVGRICMLVPGIAFDAAGNRVGYGAGYYDRMLQLVRANPCNQVCAIGAAFAFQVVGALPVEPHDERLDAVVTAQGWICCEGGG